MDLPDVPKPRRAGVQGWRQLLTAKQGMLADFDAARTKAAGHDVQTLHGNVAERVFRDWLERFLPKRWGVTSGYLVSALLPDAEGLPHYDVIIYDALESPVLWIEETSRAIPAEYVRAVIEVKAAFDSRSANAAVKHLQELNPVITGAGVTDREARRRYVPRRIFSAIVFFELRQDDARSRALLDLLVPEQHLPGYFGGLILRGAGLSEDSAGRAMLVQQSDTSAPDFPPDKNSNLLSSWLFSKPKSYGGRQLRAFLQWHESVFSMFAFDLVALLNGTYTPGVASSLHGLNWQAADPQD